ncbi:MAG: tripartite tricarboxylate transporter TctB family protein [Alphaproteobacteria bacterium]|nr:tripartite tricarboxylate transporter TctB family protein [Alphaproteobacteria bacterium]
MAQPLLSASGERAAAAVLAAFGVTALYKASTLPFGSVREPGSGFFPILIGAALVLFAVVSFFAPSRKLPEGEAAAHGDWLVWSVVIALVAYALALPRVGFVPCTAAIVLILLRGVGALPWRSSLAIAVIAAVACYAFFTRLGVPLPPGILAFR